MAMTDKEREERAKERARRKRMARVKVVWAALGRKRKTSRQISDEVGLSKDTVKSTINFIRKETEDWPGKPVGYDPRTHEYWVSATWAEHKIGIEWLRRHLVTRANSLAAFIDVAFGLWEDDIPVELLAGMQQLEDAIKRLDHAVMSIPERAELSAKKPPNLIG